jgi:hypothetical protein
MKIDHSSKIALVVISSFLFVFLLVITAIYFLNILGFIWNNSEKLGNLATGLATIIAAFAILVGLREYKRSERQSKIENTIRYISKFYDPVFIQYNIDARRKIMQGAKVDDIVKDDKIRPQAVSIFNYFEDLAYMYQQEIIDRDVIRDLMKGPICDFYESSTDILEHFKTKESGLMGSWKDVYNELHKIED